MTGLAVAHAVTPLLLVQHPGAARRVRWVLLLPCATTAAWEGSVSGGCIEDDLLATPGQWQ